MPKKTPTKSKSSDKNIDLEKTMQELEKLVERMERGDLTLEQSLKDFERGVELTRHAQSALRDAEQKVQLLMKSAGQDTLVDFEEDPDA
jgi:exodeoxyribonuclease VII small subunit